MFLRRFHIVVDIIRNNRLLVSFHLFFFVSDIGSGIIYNVKTNEQWYKIRILFEIPDSKKQKYFYLILSYYKCCVNVYFALCSIMEIHA